jgi:tetratricopeptide (TPR) repeat protein
MAAGAGLKPQVLLHALRPAYARFRLGIAPDQALREYQEVLRAYPLEDMPPTDRQQLTIAVQLARMGDFAAADSYLDAYEREIPLDERLDPEPLERARARTALLRAPSLQTIEAFRRYDTESCPICELPEIGRGYDAIGERDSAIAVYRRFTDTSWLNRINADGAWLAIVLRRLGELYEEAAQPEDAVVYYGRFLELWRDADTELQPQVQAVRRRMMAITSRG